MKSVNLRLLRRGLLVAAVLAVAVAAWFGWSWRAAAQDDELTRARERDDVLSTASTALTALNTVDHRTVQFDYDRWLQVSTGQFGKDLAADREEHVRRTGETRTMATASVRQAALVELLPDTARLVAVLDVRIGINDEPPVPNRSRLAVELTRTEQGWKVSAVQAG
ncbi:hypothetical protein [Amycolatopsis magusensis]|uniref:hypothetical protein n=1 Tax=Amycolatopsis magusensis TaxID=882444 RepID=UPI0037B8A7B1